ncbi:MAG: hypothetical protein M1814_003813 [Vezdaea aestivalis]|nr:MAG: hypothetical protein M1814_003813 [Vezdaea aestivalis]
MGFSPAVLWKAPEINPINRKARSVPVLNVVNVYGRVFFFAWFGFLIAFWSWYAFPPLLTITIKKDLHLSTKEVANSNIISLTATLLVRLVAGPSCDRYGPRNTFAGVLLIGSIPTALAGTIHNAMGLYFIRFFVGILGGSFVPCQVWSTGFFDKNVVGTSNALTGGWGNAGGGITYFLMPAIFDSLVHARGLTPHVAWRVTFIVPFICITVTAIFMLLLCPDTPTGRWSDRKIAAEQNLQAHVPGAVVDVPTGKLGEKYTSGTESPASSEKYDEKKPVAAAPAAHEVEIGQQEMINAAQAEVVVKPSFKEAMYVVFSLQTLTLAAGYFNSFGAELAINSILGTYYLKNFPKLGQTQSGRWAAMFGLLNVAYRPLGGMISDVLYKKTHSLWVKKAWIHFLGVVTGCFCIAIGLVDSRNTHTMFGLVAGMAAFLEAGNGANFSLVPHVHPYANGIVSGVTGATGNLGGIVFAIIFRYNGTHYARTIWIIGIIGIVMNLAVAWIPPVPRRQLGGR